LIDIFAAYGIVKEVLASQSATRFTIIPNMIWLIIQYAIKVFIAHVGSSTTDEAEKSVVIVTKALGSLEFSEDLKVDLNFLLTQMRCRNKNLQNVFFAINWNFILAVNLICSFQGF
jgi:hypothetical protein